MSLSAHTRLVHQLLQLQRERATGALTVSADEQFTVVYFEAGRSVFADSPAVNLTLGRILLEDGYITHQQYTVAIGELRRALSSDRHAKLGGILVNLGFLGVEGVQDALFKQMARRVAGLMQYTEPTAKWVAGDSQLKSVPRYPMRVEPLIHEGVSAYYDRAQMSQVLAPFRGGYLLLRAPAELVVRCFSLTPDLAEIVASIDGADLTEVWLMRQSTEEAWPLATALALTGVLTVKAAAPTSAVAAQEAASQATLAEPGNTGIFQVPEIHQVAPPVDPAFAPKAVALTPVVDPPDREQLLRLEAEGACRVGIDLLHAETFDEAEKQFRIATRAMPRVIEYKLYWAWASARMEGDMPESTLRELAQLAATAARQDSQHAFPPYVTAHIALTRGENDTALRFFKVAQRRDPDNKDAVAQIRRLSRRHR